MSRRGEYLLVLYERRYVYPQGGPGDHPLYALYRIYENLVLCNTVALRNEFENFWRNRWPVESIPNPRAAAGDPARYAVLACIPLLLVSSFNERINRGVPRDAPALVRREDIESYRSRPKVFERVPHWVTTVPPSEKLLIIPHEKGETLKSIWDPRASPEMLQKNVLHWQPHIYFL